MCLSRCRKAPGLHVVIDEPVYKNLNQSFAELDIFPENKGDVVWSFMQKLHNHPYETALNAFSKVTDVLCKFFSCVSETILDGLKKII